MSCVFPVSLLWLPSTSAPPPAGPSEPLAPAVSFPLFLMYLLPPLLAQDRYAEQGQSRVKESGSQGLEALSLAFSPS